MIFVILYLGIGFIMGLIIMIGMIKQVQTVPNVSDTILMRVALEKQRRSVLGRLRRCSLVAGASLLGVVGWPYFIFTAILRMRCGPRARYTQGLVGSDEVLLPAFLAVLAASTLWTCAVFGTSRGTTLVAVTLLVGLSVRLVLWSTSETDLPASLRRQLLHPHVAFALIALADFVTLVLASLALEWQPDRGLTLAVVTGQVSSLASFSHATTFFKNTPSTLSDVFIAVVSFAFFATVVNRVLRYKDFRRTAKDQAFAISALAYAGRFREAKRRFESIDPSMRNHSDLLAAKALVATLECDFEPAFRATENIVRLSGDWAGRPLTVDDISTNLTWLSFRWDLNPDKRADLVVFCVGRGASDGALAETLWPHTDFTLQPILSRLRELPNRNTYPLTELVLDSGPFGADMDAGAVASLHCSLWTDELVRLWILFFIRWFDDDEIDLEAVTSLVGAETDDMPGWLLYRYYLWLRRIVDVLKGKGYDGVVEKAEQQLVNVASAGTAEEVSNLEVFIAANPTPQFGGSPRSTL